MKVPGIGRGEPALGVVSFEVEASILPLLEGHHVPRVVAIGEDPLRPYIVMEEIARREPRGPRATHAACPGRGRAASAPRSPTHCTTSIASTSCITTSSPRTASMRADGEVVLLDFGYRASRDASRPPRRGGRSSRPARRLTCRRNSCAAVEAIRAATSLRSASCSTSSRPASCLSAILPPTAACATACGACPSRRERSRRPSTAPLQEVILRCLEVDPAKRPPSAAHVAFDLRNPGTGAAHVARRMDSPRRASRDRRAAGGPPVAQRRCAGSIRRGGCRPSSSSPSTPSIPHDDRHPALQRAARMLLSMYGELSPDRRLGHSRRAARARAVDLEETASGKHLAHRSRLRAWIAPLGAPRRTRRFTWSSPTTQPPPYSRSRTRTTSTSSSSARRLRATARSPGGVRSPPKSPRALRATCTSCASSRTTCRSQDDALTPALRPRRVPTAAAAGARRRD